VLGFARERVSCLKHNVAVSEAVGYETGRPLKVMSCSEALSLRPNGRGEDPLHKIFQVRWRDCACPPAHQLTLVYAGFVWCCFVLCFGSCTPFPLPLLPSQDASTGGAIMVLEAAENLVQLTNEMVRSISIRTTDRASSHRRTYSREQASSRVGLQAVKSLLYNISRYPGIVLLLATVRCVVQACAWCTAAHSLPAGCVRWLTCAPCLSLPSLFCAATPESSWQMVLIAPSHKS